MNKSPDNEKLARYLSGECTESEKNDIEIWISSDPRNKKIIELMGNVWRSEKTGSGEWNIGKLWNKIVKEAGLHNPPADRGRIIPLLGRINSSKLLKIAAVLLLFVSVPFIYNKISTSVNYEQSREEMRNLVVATGEKTRITLSDGTEIQLDSESSFWYPEDFTGNSREVYLEGEGFFEVTPDPEKPFLIHANGAVVTVLGTRFNVRAWRKDWKITVAVEEGRVAFRSEKAKDREAVTISGGQVSALDEFGRVTNPRTIDVRRYFGWMDRKIIFEDAPLMEILDLIERWHGVKVILTDEIYGSERLTVNIQNKSLQDTFDLLGALTSMKYEKNGDEYLFSPVK